MKKIYIADMSAEGAEASHSVFEEAARSLGLDIEVVRFEDGHALLERIRQAPPDLVVVGFLLPAVNGLAVCRLVKYQSASRHVPVYLSGWPGKSDLEARLAAVGADGFVPKPWSVDVIAATLQTVLVAASA